MVGGEAVGAFEFDEEFVFDEDVGDEGSEVVAFVGDFEFGLGDGLDASDFEFFEEGSFVDFFEEAGAEGVGYFEDGVEDFVGEGVVDGGIGGGHGLRLFSWGGGDFFSGFFGRDGRDFGG